MRLLTLIILSLVATLNIQAAGITKVFELAAKQDPALNAARAKYNADIEIKPQTRALLLPNVSLQASSSKGSFKNTLADTPAIDDNNDTISLTLTQTIFNYGLFMRLKQANTSVKKATADLSIAYQDLVIRVAERYFAVLTAIDELEFARAEKRAIDRQLTQVKKRFEVGLTAITNVHEAKAARDLALAKVINAQNELANRREALREITNEDVDIYLRPLKNDIPLVSPQPANLSSWTETALKQNLSLKSVKYAVESAKLEIRVQRSEHLPSVDVIASKSQTDAEGGFFTQQRENESDSVQVRLKVPLFSGGLTTSKTRQAKSLYQEAKDKLEQQTRAVTRQTRDAYRGVISGINQVRALQQAIISSQSALKATTTGYRVGTRNIVDVFKAQQDLFKAKSDYTSARHQYILNLLRLKQAAGTLSINDIKKVNQWLLVPGTNSDDSPVK